MSDIKKEIKDCLSNCIHNPRGFVHLYNEMLTPFETLSSYYASEGLYKTVLSSFISDVVYKIDMERDEMGVELESLIYKKAVQRGISSCFAKYIETYEEIVQKNGREFKVFVGVQENIPYKIKEGKPSSFYTKTVNAKVKDKILVLPRIIKENDKAFNILQKSNDDRTSNNLNNLKNILIYDQGYFRSMCKNYGWKKFYKLLKFLDGYRCGYDLHSQNVRLDKDYNIVIIDYAPSVYDKEAFKLEIS